MNNGTLLTADKASIFQPLTNAVSNGLVTGYAYANQIVLQVPNIGQVTIQIVEHQ